MSSQRPTESDLYGPVKSLLVGQGYDVKGEVGAADLVAVHPEALEEPVVVELKVNFSLSLVHQGIARQAISDWVYLAVPTGSGQRWHTSLKANQKLCRRLGLGLIVVRLRDEHVQVVVDPAPFKPRKSAQRKRLLLREFARREGDPNLGGSASRGGTVTAYRQDADRLRVYLLEHGPTKGAHVAKATGVKLATRMMADNHYGWFERISPGVYGLRADNDGGAHE